MPTDDADKLALAQKIADVIDRAGWLDYRDVGRNTAHGEVVEIIKEHLAPLVERAHEADSLKRTIIKQDNVIAGLMKRIEGQKIAASPVTHNPQEDAHYDRVDPVTGEDHG